MTLTLRVMGFILASVVLLSVPPVDNAGGTVPATVVPEAALPEPAGPYPYRSFSDIRSELLQVDATYPDIADVWDIGDSWEKTQNISDRDILAVKISDNVLIDEDEPEVLIMALHHAREWTTSEIAMEAIALLTSEYGNDTRVSWLVDNREVWIVPVVNPDGLEFSQTSDSTWRKNRRDNGDTTYGVDLNRNYNGSANNDSAGAWGGEGSSHDTFSDVYCGLAPFSEPETQAIRELVLQRNFTMCLDFHSYGDLVMWPWGYTTNVTPDNSALVSLGTQLAALNGYTADQSVGLYPTTGDSLDWMYGFDNIFAILFEVGDTSFHPVTTPEVEGIIAESLPPILLGIELAGDKYQRGFSIDHTPLGTVEYAASGYEIVANITADRGVDSSGIELVCRVDGGEWQTAGMGLSVLNDTYAGILPSGQPGGQIEYYIVAHDLGGVELMSPRYAPYEIHTMIVIDSTPPVADAGDDATALLGELVALNASASYDNHGVSNFTWSFWYNGSQVLLYGQSVEFTFWVSGSYQVILTVADSSGNYDTDEMYVDVQDVYIPELSSPLVVAITLLCLIALVSLRRRL